MKIIKSLPAKAIILSVCILGAFIVFAQNPINWTDKQLMEPSVLASALKSGKNIPVILSVGPGAVIPHSTDIGMVKDADNLAKFRNALAGLSKETKVVVYCGCCPFERCPNVRPAIAALKELKFTNYYLLNIPSNIKKDWIDKGYPVN
jgi:thiosulfate/3-mercaptopyruvate sulfurtransferase